MISSQKCGFHPGPCAMSDHGPRLPRYPTKPSAFMAAILACSVAVVSCSTMPFLSTSRMYRFVSRGSDTRLSERVIAAAAFFTRSMASGVWRLASGVWRLASGVWRLASGWLSGINTVKRILLIASHTRAISLANGHARLLAQLIALAAFRRTL